MPAMAKRFGIGAVLIAILVGVYLLDAHVFGRPFAARFVLWLLGLAALREALALGARKVECAPGLFIYAGIAVIAVTVPYFVSGAAVPGTLVALAAVLGGTFRLLGEAPRRSTAAVMPEVLLLAGALLYVPGMLVFLDRILVVGGVATAFAVVLVSKTSDICGYVVGTLLGRKRIAPAVSPKKTWEGTIAGVLGSAGVAALLSPELVGPPAFSALVGALIGLASFLGDLAESGFKRWAGAKDSGALLPEFGGALDMLDGVLVAAPVAVVCLYGA